MQQEVQMGTDLVDGNTISKPAHELIRFWRQQVPVALLVVLAFLVGGSAVWPEQKWVCAAALHTVSLWAYIL